MAGFVIYGYPEDRFISEVNDTFHCPICMNVLKDPMQCKQNEHLFCSSCITKHLYENSMTCPICVDNLTPETLAKAPRVLTDYLSSLKITCDFAPRGCREVVELRNLKNHVGQCEFAPVECPKCNTIVDKKDKAEHDEHHSSLLSKEVDKLKVEMLEIKQQVAEKERKHELWVEQLKKKIKDELRDEIRNEIKEEFRRRGTATVHYKPSPWRADIVVIGGRNEKDMPLNSVETFNWEEMSWRTTSHTRNNRFSATSVCYQNRIVIAGGTIEVPQFTSTNEAEQLLCNQVAEQWVNFPVKLPYHCSGHGSVISGNSLLLVGGIKSNGKCSNEIYEILLDPPYTRSLKSQIPMPVSYYGLQCFGDKLLILGGSSNGALDGVNKEVLLYDLNNNGYQRMPSLPFDMCDMATVKWGDEVVIIIGGAGGDDMALNTVFMYNYKDQSCYALPKMKYARRECAAVVTGDAIVVVGGYNKQQGVLNTVEYFTFENFAWRDLPAMYERRDKVTAVVKPSIVT